MGNSVASITGGSILSSANVGNDKSTTSTGSRNNNSNNNTTMIYNNIYNFIISNELVKSWMWLNDEQMRMSQKYIVIALWKELKLCVLLIFNEHVFISFQYTDNIIQYDGASNNDSRSIEILNTPERKTGSASVSSPPPSSSHSMPSSAATKNRNPLKICRDATSQTTIQYNCTSDRRKNNLYVLMYHYYPRICAIRQFIFIHE